VAARRHADLARPAPQSDLRAPLPTRAASNPKRRGALARDRKSRNLPESVPFSRHAVLVGDQDAQPSPTRATAGPRAPGVRAPGRASLPQRQQREGLALRGARACDRGPLEHRSVFEVEALADLVAAP